MRGTVIGERFVIEEPLEERGDVAAFIGRDGSTGERVLVKRLDGARSPQPAGDATPRHELEHPAVAQILHDDVDGSGRRFHVQELCDGPTLADELRAGPVSPGRVARIGEALCSALAAAHAAGVVHGGVTSACVIMTDALPGLKLMDFGLVDDDGGEHREAADVLAAGRLLFEALAPEQTQQTLGAQAAARVTPVELVRSLDGALAVDPTARPSAGALATMLGSIADALGAATLAAAANSGALSRLLREVAHVPHVAASLSASGGVLLSDRFEVRKQLGQGGFGIVYEAFDKVRNDVVAVKALARVDGEKLYRFKKEFRALSAIVHPNLVRLHELFAVDHAWFFTMELVRGADFVSFVRGRPDDLRRCLRQLVDGIASIHAAGRLHRDVKPQNVLVTTSGDVKILDFGLVAELAPDDQQTAESAGTPAYIAPETIGGTAPTAATDWYSFGALLYEALTGSIPFAGARGNILVEKLIGEPAEPHTLAPSAPRDLASLASALLRREPAARPNIDAIRAVTHAQAPPGTAGESVAMLERGATIGFFGRASELAMMRAALADSSAAPVVLVLEGESGIGKTALARRFLAEVRDIDGAAVLTGRCYEREAVPYKAFDGVIDSLSRHLRSLPAAEVASVFPRRKDAGMLARLFPVLERVPGWPAPLLNEGARVAHTHELRSQAFTALRELFARLAERGPVAVFIDDMQWADADSHALLEALLLPPQPPPLLLLCTARVGPAAIIAGAPRRILLAGLAPDDVTAMAGAFGVGAGAEHVADEARGHPLFVQELLLHGDEHRALRLEDVLWARVSRLGPSQRLLVELSSLAGRPMSVSLLGEAAGLPARAILDDGAALCASRLLRPANDADAFEPYHDRVRELVTARLDDASRRSLHRRLADALESPGRDADPALLMRHLAGAGDEARAAVFAERAAAAAAAALAFEEAAELYGAALTWGAATGDVRQRLLVARARAFADAGRAPEAAKCFLDAADGAEGQARTTLRGRAAVQLLACGHDAEARVLLADVLPAVGLPWAKSESGAMMSAIFARARLTLRGLSYTPCDPSTLPAHEIIRLEIQEEIGDILVVSELLRGLTLHTSGLLRALDLGHPRFVARALTREASIRAFAGSKRLPECLSILERARVAGEGVADPGLAGVRTHATGMVHFMACEFRKAMEYFSAAEELHVPEVHTFGSGLEIIRFFRLGAKKNLGMLGDVARGVDACLADARRRGDRFLEYQVVHALAMGWLCADDIARARQEIARCAARRTDAGRMDLDWSSLFGRCDVDLYAGDAEGCFARERSTIASFGRSPIRSAQIFRVELSALHARIELAAGTRDAAARADRTAQKLLREGVPYATGKAHFLTAAAHARRGALEDAASTLRIAADFADGQGTPFFAAVARHRLGELLGGDEGRALVVAADAVMRNEAVRQPARMLEVYAPGFSRPPGG